MATSWLDKTEYPFQSRYFEVDGYQLHYIDEGVGEVLLFVHGTPSWSFDFRHLIKTLRKTNRCIALDHMGFGLSNKPEVYDYSTQHHSHTLKKFIEDRQLEKFTMVVHDFGGPIGLHAAMLHHEKVLALVILNSWLWSSWNDPDYMRFRKVLKSPLLPFLYKYLNFSPKFILPRSFGKHKISRSTLKQYTRPFADSTQRNGALAFARSLLNDQDWFEDLWNRKQCIASKPTLLVWGMKDPVIRPHCLEKFRQGFTNSEVVMLEECGHFPQEEEPDKVTKAVLEFMKRK